MIKIYNNNNLEKALEKLKLITNTKKKALKRHEFFESRNTRRNKKIREKLRNKKLKTKGKP
jgi:ribosomal protein S21